MNFNEHPNRGRTYVSTRGRGNSSSNGTWNNKPMGPTKTRENSTGRRSTSSERPIRDANVTGRGHSTSCNDSKHGRSQPSDLDRREKDNYDQAGHSRDAAAIATAFEPLKMSLGTFLTRLSRTGEHS